MEHQSIIDIKEKIDKIDLKIDIITEKVSFIEVLKERTAAHRWLIGIILAGLLGLTFKVLL